MLRILWHCWYVEILTLWLSESEHLLENLHDTIPFPWIFIVQSKYMRQLGYSSFASMFKIDSSGKICHQFVILNWIFYQVIYDCFPVYRFWSYVRDVIFTRKQMDCASLPCKSPQQDRILKQVFQRNLYGKSTAWYIEYSGVTTQWSIVKHKKSSRERNIGIILGEVLLQIIFPCSVQPVSSCWPSM